MKALYLTGYMGAGKTSIGERLAEVLEIPVIDTDHYIEEKAGKSIPEIFAKDGEAEFRRYEREYLRSLPTENVIITTGGGIVIQAENREWMQENGIVVYLHCDIEEIFNRVTVDETRPLFDLTQKEAVAKRFQDRLPLYKEAHFTVDTTKQTMEEVVNEIQNLLKKVESGHTI